MRWRRPNNAGERGDVSDEEHEIIEQEEVSSEEPKRIKIKIKERVSRRTQRKISLPLKVFFLLLASLVGYYFGSRVVERYVRYWASPSVRFYTPKDKDDVLPSQLQSGQVVTFK